MLFFSFEHVTPVYIYSILYVVSLFCCHACIMQCGLCGGYSCRCVLSYLPLGPSLLCPGIPASSQLHGHLPAPGSPPFYYQRRGLQSPDGPRQTLHWEEITAFVFVPLITLSLVHVREWWFQNMRKLGESSWLIRFTNHSFISLQVGVSMFLRTKRLYFFESFFFFFFLNQLNYSKAEWYHN